MSNQAVAYSLRSAKLSDAELIFDVIHRHSDDLVPRPMGDIVANIDRFTVAEVAGKMVGCAAYMVLPEIGAPRHATVEVQSVAVLAGYRRLGIGRALVLHILDEVAAFEPAEVLVLTFAPEFFASLGFREIPKTQVMHKLYSGCMNCTKHANPFTCPEKAMAVKVERVKC